MWVHRPQTLDVVQALSSSSATIDTKGNWESNPLPHSPVCPSPSITHPGQAFPQSSLPGPHMAQREGLLLGVAWPIEGPQASV